MIGSFTISQLYSVGVWEPAERLSPVFPALPDRSPGGRGCARPVTAVQHLPALLHTRTETSAATTAAATASAAAAAATTTLSGMEVWRSYAVKTLSQL